MSNIYYDAPYLDEEEHAVIDHTGIPGIGGGDSAVSAAQEFTTEAIPNVITGDGDLTVMVLPPDGAVIGVKVEGDDFPSMYLIVGNGDTGIWMSDGTQDPYDDGGGSIFYDGTDLTLNSSSAGIKLVAPKAGFFNGAPVVKPTGVAVTAEAIHAALVSLGLIAGP